MSGVARIVRVGVIGLGLPLLLLVFNFPQLFFRFLDEATKGATGTGTTSTTTKSDELIAGLGLSMRICIGFTLWELLTAIGIIFFTVDLSFMLDFGLSGAFIGLVTYVLPDALFEGDSSLYSWAASLVGPLLLMLESVQIVSFIRRLSNRLYTSPYSDSHPNAVVTVSNDTLLEHN